MLLADDLGEGVLGGDRVTQDDGIPPTGEPEHPSDPGWMVRASWMPGWLADVGTHGWCITGCLWSCWVPRVLARAEWAQAG